MWKYFDEVAFVVVGEDSFFGFSEGFTQESEESPEGTSYTPRYENEEPPDDWVVVVKPRPTLTLAQVYGSGLSGLFKTQLAALVYLSGIPGFDGLVFDHRDPRIRIRWSGSEAPLHNRHLLWRLDEINMSVRANGAVRRTGCERVGDLVQCSRQKVSGLPNVGKRTLKELDEILESMDLHFDTPLPLDWANLVEAMSGSATGRTPVEGAS